MIRYNKLFKTMKEKGITQYDLYTKYNVPKSLLDRLRNDKNVEVVTINKLCNILQCNVEDIMEHTPDDDSF